MNTIRAEKFKKIPVYLSIDFEDWTHDYIRLMKNSEPVINEDALWRSYKKIQELSNRFLSGKKITFFVTGVCARAVPNLIKRIHDDGHEIGCHYNFHDDISAQNSTILAKNLDIAIKSIENITGEKPRGFRAPRFAINSDDEWAYKIISEKFEYDSSYKTSEKYNDINKVFSNTSYKNNFKEYFIYGHNISILFKKIKIRSGGTYLRLFSANIIKDCLKKQHELGHTPLIYFHPYELMLDADFWVPYKFFKNKSFMAGLIAWARQIQWLKIGHKGLIKKLEIIFQDFEHQGTMGSIVNKK